MYKTTTKSSTFKYLSHKRLMATHNLSKFPKTSSFTQHITPDFRIPDHQTALDNHDNVTNKARILKDGGFSWGLPEKRKSYKYLTSSDRAIADLGLDPEQVNDKTYQQIVSGQIYHEDPTFLENNPLPYSQAYAGWQFGQFAGQLGDGRVHNLFEIPKANDNDKNNRHKYEFQLKGSGLTPYSRFADGKAVLRSSIREYIISEHLNAIGIPSTRALSLTYLPETFAQRHAAEKCAVVSRFAESWIRLGSFDLYRWRGDRKGVRQLSDYVINELFTIDGLKFTHLDKILDLKDDFFDGSKNSIGDLTDYDKMYLEIIVRNATTTAKWQCYGFLNGVLNTDNTSVLGLSIDFGPFSIMDKYDPNYTPNSEDHQRRYGYANTPTAIWWNLTRLGEDLAELIGAGPELINDDFFLNDGVKQQWEDKIITRATKLIEVGGEIYKYAFTRTYVETMFARLGLSPELIDNANPDAQNVELIDPMLDMLYKARCDYNKFFLIMQSLDLDTGSFDSEKASQLILLPSYNKNSSKYNQQELKDDINSWLTTYAKYLNKSEKSAPGTRKALTTSHNPRFLPRNWILDQVISYTQEHSGDDLSYLKKLEKMSFHPFEKSKWGSELKELESTWLLQSDIGEDFSMQTCSCSS